MAERYPIGKLVIKDSITEADLKEWIQDLEEAPERLNQAVKGLSDEQLDTPYREGGWTIRQVVHHLADAHLNAYLRIKLALTEATPKITPFDEVLWAELPDTKLSAEVSLNLLQATHQRLVALLKAIHAGDFKKALYHAVTGEMSVEQLVATYAWHSQHHIAHITTFREEKGW